MRVDLVLILALPVIAFAHMSVFAQADRAGGNVLARAETEMAAAARNWASLLDKGQSRQALFEFNDDERFNWHYIPRNRQGLALRDMTAEQNQAARNLIKATLSQQGATKVEAIMALEAVLREVEGSSSGFRDPENYAFSLFGEPGTPPWGWRVEGHHLSINVTNAASGDISITPTFTGTNPARIPLGPRTGERIQKDEYFLALELAVSLDEGQRGKAVLGERSLGNIVTGPGRADALKQPEGLAVGDLSAEQKDLLLRLVATYVGLARDEVGERYMDLVHGGLGETRFAWAGGMSEGEAFYYRVHGPRILIEFDNTQNNANHIHAVWRDPLDDFGRDTLKEHYDSAGPGHGHRQ